MSGAADGWRRGAPDFVFDDAPEGQPGVEQMLPERARRRLEAPRERDPGRHYTPARMSAARAEVERMMRDGDWGSASPRHFVALHELLHEGVLGFAPTMPPAERHRAALAAGRMLRAHFGGDPARMAIFMSWAWARERSRERWRKENGREAGRFGWRANFSDGAADDHRLDEARRRAR